jgi:hypothetical protein
MESPTLADLRKQSDKSLGTILAELRRDFPDVCPTARSGIIHWEKQGITNARVIRALSSIYGVSLEVAEEAAFASKRAYYARQGSQKSLPETATLA